MLSRLHDLVAPGDVFGKGALGTVQAQRYKLILLILYPQVLLAEVRQRH